MIANIIDAGASKSISVQKPSISGPEKQLQATTSAQTASEQSLEIASKSSSSSSKYPRQQIYNPRPKYPLSSRRLKEEGVVTAKPVSYTHLTLPTIYSV